MSGYSNDDDDDDDELRSELRAGVKEILQAWLNEKNAPELLKFPSQALSELNELVEQQDQIIAQSAVESVSKAFFSNLLQMELDRVKFIIRSYLRTRLTKIQKYAFYILQTPEQRQLLSSEEYEFLKGYVTLLETHFTESCLKDFPEDLQNLANMDMIAQPDLNTHVFCKVENDVGEFELEDSPTDRSTTTLSKGDQYILRYNPIKSLVESNDVVFLLRFNRLDSMNW